MHPDADIPFYNTMTTDILSPGINSYKKFTISVTDIENEPEIRQLSVAQRKCRFADENNLEVSDEYSYSACVTDCRRKEQLRVCNCTSHLMPKTEPRERCNMSGINCLNNHYSDLSVQKTSWSRKEGLICDCLPGCHEAEYNVVTVSGYEIAENQSNIEIMLDRLPTERFKRTVVRGRLDLVVSMGGTAGLFVGASLLSLVEIFYFLLFRRRDSLQDGSGDPGARDPEGPTVPARAVPSLQPRFYQPPSPSKLTRQYPTTHRSVAYFNP
ncbi:hypothetical protein AAG570_009686 [Ranatra chinensis]|uniref:Uncharacterized protein n=1 Tax=Ranatra chinensis TaxID=642074 RepID=A0ABD0YQF1_9HEMI